LWIYQISGVILEMIQDSRQVNSDEGTGPDNVYVARQPVFDREMNIWGYELLFREGAGSQSAAFQDGDLATSRVIADGFGLATEWLRENQRVLINYPASMLLGGSPRALPPETAVVEILETVRPDREILEICIQLKEEGYSLALDDFVGSPGYEPLLELADLVKVDVLGMHRDELERIVNDLQRHKCLLLAEKVEDLEMFDCCRELGFSYFQGFFFSRPQLVSGKKLSSSRISKVNLLQELGRPDLDFTRISEIIKGDVSLSYRLLRYINSPGMGLAYDVKSISQAVTMLGQRRIAAWLRVLVLADMDPSPRARELLFFCLQRAWFLEAVCDRGEAVCMESDSMFLLGLFSSLDALLAQPMEEIVQKISLDERLRDVLMGRNPEMQAWLDLAMAGERGQWDIVERTLKHLGVSREDAARIQNQATARARQFLDLV